MSNELTPQEKHPKFYANPEYWINAIEVYKNGDDFNHKLTHAMFGEIMDGNRINQYVPIFKPQEGDQFIKDLESAVSAAMNEPATLLNDGDAVKLFTGGWWYVSILMENIGIVNVRSEDNDLLLFDTSKYVTTLLKLGYYL
jgi:hypothetical protein